jgi:hypothetical protein
MSPEEQRLYETYAKWTGQLRFGGDLRSGTERGIREKLDTGIPGVCLSEGQRWREIRSGGEPALQAPPEK